MKSGTVSPFFHLVSTASSHNEYMEVDSEQVAFLWCYWRQSQDTGLCQAIHKVATSIIYHCQFTVEQHVFMVKDQTKNIGFLTMRKRLLQTGASVTDIHLRLVRESCKKWRRQPSPEIVLYLCALSCAYYAIHVAMLGHLYYCLMVKSN
jgi:hypothetical protein